MCLVTKHTRHGMHWIRNDKRIAIYLRDGGKCAYCQARPGERVRLTLDHLIPAELGGGNEASNLITACLSCNGARGLKDWRKFAQSAAIRAFITRSVQQPLPMTRAKALLAEFGFGKSVARCGRAA